jgi:hypothetical protein
MSEHLSHLVSKPLSLTTCQEVAETHVVSAGRLATEHAAALMRMVNCNTHRSHNRTRELNFPGVVSTTGKIGMLLARIVWGER